MRSFVFLFVGLMSASPAFAGYDFTIQGFRLRLQTRDGIAIPSAAYDYYIDAEELHVPCTGDWGEPTAPSCWRLAGVEGGRLVTDSNGVVTLPEKHFKNDSPMW